MEAEKLQRLHDTLSKLAPRGKVGGLGLGGLNAKGAASRDPTLPNNPLYSNFVRAGSGFGQYHKRKFDNFEEEPSPVEENESEKKDKKGKKEKKSKKDKAEGEGESEKSSKKEKKEKKNKDKKENNAHYEVPPVAEHKVELADESDNVDEFEHRSKRRRMSETLSAEPHFVSPPVTPAKPAEEESSKDKKKSKKEKKEKEKKEKKEKK